jgi:hypothetical protein
MQNGKGSLRRGADIHYVRTDVLFRYASLDDERLMPVAYQQMQNIGVNCHFGHKYSGACRGAVR